MTDSRDFSQEAFTFRDLVARSGRQRQSRTFLDVPIALKEDPKRFAYLLKDGCQHLKD